jgi:hypothetical protein
MPLARLEGLKCSGLIKLHEPAISDDISSQDGS